jgi:arsenate reductase
MYTLYHYPSCSTCKKAIKWLDTKGIQYEALHIVEKTPDATQLQRIHEDSGFPIVKLLNTSGKRYRELKLKDQIKDMSDQDVYSLLASEGMLIKRPILCKPGFALIGFSEVFWETVVI